MGRKLTGDDDPCTMDDITSMDKDGNGSFDKWEAAEMCIPAYEFDMFDMNGDGMINTDDCDMMASAMASQMGPESMAPGATGPSETVMPPMPPP